MNPAMNNTGNGIARDLGRVSSECARVCETVMRVEQMTEVLCKRLEPVLMTGPEPNVGANAPSMTAPGQSVSPMAEQLSAITARLLAVLYRLERANGRLEL
jgi:hypothetical protein